MSPVAKLAGTVLGFVLRVGVDLGKEWWQQRQDKKAHRIGLSHADSERQAQAARSAGPNGGSKHERK